MSRWGPDSDCRCFVCGRCYHDHGGLAHEWTDKRPCPSNKGYSTGDFNDWCSLQKDHPGDCIYRSEI